MQEKRSDGGPAFPREDYQTQNAGGQCGISARDYFAAHEHTEPDSWFAEEFKARKLGLKPNDAGVWTKSLTPAERMQMRAEWRFACADAMLAAREAE